ncbi:MAG: zinc-ribbon domain-containing protein, partial [Pyramidobacter sp.]|nr:zinc-ribbon domain-containing protein [Pyramidobacter sp.]
MFCSNCGRKLNPSAARCPKCGGDAAPADYCGGFWRLTERAVPTA